MNYPKMLYLGEAKYTDNEQLRNDLFSKVLKTIIVADQAQEEMRREQGYVDLAALMYRPKPKIIEVTEVATEASEPKTTEPLKVKRKYTRKVPDVSHDTA